MNEVLLRLFNAIQVKDKSSQANQPSHLERTIKQGYVLDPAIKADAKLLDTIETIVGLSGEKANSAFHKSWDIVRDTNLEELVTQQIIHYMTTYGYEALGIYRAVYIPREVLELPEIEQDIPLVVIKALTQEEILTEIIQLGSGIALAENTLNDLMTIIEKNHYTPDFVSQIKNRELQTRLYDLYDILPTEPVAYLRYVISKLTDESLLIKNNYLIEKIKAANGKYLDSLLLSAPDDLASIFFRFKPLFLAMKFISRRKTFFNQLRKKATRLHRPLLPDALNEVTAQIKNQQLDLDTLKQQLTEANLFRKIRLAYALKYRLVPNDSIVYQIRNGRSWATGFQYPVKPLTQEALDLVISSIASELEPKVDGKVIYIPENVHYALPATEKQFTGYFPAGTSVSVPEDMIVGIHWMNTQRRIDLDLAVLSERGKIGWDADYRSKEGDVLFSGDMTDAPPPHGASELFYLKKGIQEPKLLTVNYYNFQKDQPVPCKILVAHEKPTEFKKNYMVNLNHLIAAAITIDKKQTILGLIAPFQGQNRFYFSQVNARQAITSRQNEQANQTRSYLFKKGMHPLDFREILIMAGAEVVTKKPEEGDYLNLSPECLDKNTFLNLLT